MFARWERERERESRQTGSGCWRKISTSRVLSTSRASVLSFIAIAVAGKCLWNIFSRLRGLKYLNVVLVRQSDRSESNDTRGSKRATSAREREPVRTSSESSPEANGNSTLTRFSYHSHCHRDRRTYEPRVWITRARKFLVFQSQSVLIR